MTRKISVLSASERERVFGSFVYSELEGGRIRISPQWVAQNLTPCLLAKANGRGQDVMTQCHHLAKAPLEAAFDEIAGRRLWRLIHSFDGLWVARHMTWNARRPLSSHSWGIAFDLNAAANPYGGGISPENRALNEVFNRYGFAWGGDWNGAKDAMHWELADVKAKENVSRSPRLIVAVQRGEGFSYHAVPNAHMREGHFDVAPHSIASALGRDVTEKDAASDAQTPLRQVLHDMDTQVIHLGDHRADRYDPRFYVFVKPAAQTN